MLKEAMQYLLNLAKAETQLINGVTYTDKNLSPILPYGRGEKTGVLLRSLEGFCQYLLDCAGMDNFSMTGSFIVIQHSNEIEAFTQIDAYGRRFTLARLHFESEFNFQFGQFMTLENFMIGLMRNFHQGPDMEALIRLASSVSVEHSAEIKDNGVSQTITVKEGIEFSTKETKTLYELSPKRCFPELGNVPSKFFVRFKPPKDGDHKGNVLAMLTEATEDEFDCDVRARIRAALVQKLAGWVVIE
jgi:hypothetical protein